MLHPARGVAIPLEEVKVRASRSSGPGGQHANVTASRITVELDIRTCSGLSDVQRQRVLAALGPIVRAVAQDARSQARNRELALERLSQKLTAALRVQRPRTATRPTKGSKLRRLDAKSKRGAVKRSRQRPGADE